MIEVPNLLDPDAVHDRESFVAFVVASASDRRASAAAEQITPTSLYRPLFGRELGTNWEQHRQHQHHTATMRKHQGGAVLALDSQTLSTTATCFQYHDYGRRAGLKIWSSQGGAGSSRTVANADLRRIAVGATVTFSCTRRQVDSRVINR